MPEGRSAGLLDIWRRVLNSVGVILPVVVAVVLASVGVPAWLVGTVVLVLFVTLITAAIVLGQFVTRAMRRELEAGYSTLYDVADYDLRDARTLELVRTKDEAPEVPGRRSLLAGMFRVKPGTVLAEQIKRDEA